jgi:hypothetical protein
MPQPVPIPTDVAQLNAAWFDAALAEKVVGARVLDVIHGTATKIKMELDFASDGEVRSSTVWVKTGMEPHSRQIGTERVYAGETFFYRALGGRYETRTPHCYFADSDEQGNSILVLEDLGRYGAVFTEPAAPGSPELIASGLEAIARYQAASWMQPELLDDELLRSGGAFDRADCLAWLYDPAHWEDYSKRPRFEQLAPQLRDRDLLRRAHTVLRQDWLRREPWALSHGDSHFGQLYRLPNGEARLIDWQCVQVANHMQDVTNLIVSGLSVEDRRRFDRELLAGYLQALVRHGVPNPPSLEQALAVIGAYAMHQVAWVMCLVEMQPEENCAAITERASAAALDYDTIGILLGARA